MEEAESDIESARDKRRIRGEAKDNKRGNEPVGLGLNVRREVEERPTYTAPSASPVVVNVGTSDNNKDESLISRLATFATTGPEYDRSRRLRASVEILNDSVHDENERTTLAERLDLAIAHRNKVKPSELDKIKSSAFGMFDKLKEFMT